MNKMKEIRIEKVTLNVGAGKDQGKLEKGKKLLELITGVPPVTTYTLKRVPSWGLRPNLPIGCKITIRKNASELLKRLLHAKDFKLKSNHFGENGTISFGLSEYIDIEGIEYNHDVGMMGLEVSVTLKRPGYRIKKRSVRKGKIGKSHKITKDEAIKYFEDTFNVGLGEE